ncbi:MAG TPA: helix-turn-helix domain-containing protein, partial [Anaerolineae bacterium]|nr:helix-turn-helix domain-containing protein [Anaerolineae bacterium]
PLAQAITRNLAQRVLHLMGLVEDLSLRPVAARLARVLLDHSTGEVMDRRRWSTQAEMAARLGTVPEVLNRALSGLAAEALIGIERHRIRILDREGLEAKAMLSE